MRIFISIFMAVFLSVTVAAAKTPPEVLTPYKSYRTALDDKDFDKASKYAYTAWQAAEEHLGDHKTTGDLAQNYADVANLTDAKTKTIEEALLRAIALSSFYGDSAAEMKLQREVNYGTFLMKNNKDRKYKKRFELAVADAEQSGLQNSTFMGELYSLRAAYAVRKADHDDTEMYAEKAREIFRNAEDKYATSHPILATLFAGYGKEGNEEFVPAVDGISDGDAKSGKSAPAGPPLCDKSLRALDDNA